MNGIAAAQIGNGKREVQRIVDHVQTFSIPLTPGTDEIIDL